MYDIIHGEAKLTDPEL